MFFTPLQFFGQLTVKNNHSQFLKFFLPFFPYRPLRCSLTRIEPINLYYILVAWGALPIMGDSVSTATPTRSSEDVEDRLARGDGAGDAAVVWGRI
jgi:hypothetical protein